MPFQKGHKFASGGKRENAGRRPKEAKELGEAQAAKDLESIREIASAPATSDKVRLTAYTYLVDRALGKPKDPKEHSGKIVIQVEGWDEELAK